MAAAALVFLSLFFVAAQCVNISTSQVEKRQADQYYDNNQYYQNQYSATPGGRYNPYTPYNPYNAYRSGYQGYNPYESKYPYYPGSTNGYPGAYNPNVYPGAYNSAAAYPGAYNSAAFGATRNYPYPTPAGK